MDEASPNHDIIERILEKRRAGAFGEAERLCRTALAEQPDNTALIFALGQIAAEGGRFPDALNCYRWAEGAGLDSPELCRAIGEACQEMRWNEQAEEAFRHCLEFDPYNTDIWIRLGVALSSQQKHVEAVHLMHSTAHLLPTPKNYFNWGQALLAAGSVAQSVEVFQSGIALGDTPASLHIALAQALSALGRTEEAVASARTGLDMEPDNASAKALLAKLTGAG